MRNPSIAILGVVVAAMLTSSPVSAQTPANAAAPCTAPKYRQFDFWIGEWDVTTPQGQAAGSSRITVILGGCVILEEWTGAAGPSRGQSFNIFDARTRRWHQTWVDNGGLLAQFDGGLLDDGSMRMEGTGQPANGKPTRSRMTFTPLPDGRVRQLWENSADEGATWTTAFDGYYARRK